MVFAFLHAFKKEYITKEHSANKVKQAYKCVGGFQTVTHTSTYSSDL